MRKRRSPRGAVPSGTQVPTLPPAVSAVALPKGMVRTRRSRLPANCAQLSPASKSTPAATQAGALVVEHPDRKLCVSVPARRVSVGSPLPPVRLPVQGHGQAGGGALADLRWWWRFRTALRLRRAGHHRIAHRLGTQHADATPVGPVVPVSVCALVVPASTDSLICTGTPGTALAASPSPSSTV